MKLGFLADAHGNLIGLDQALGALRAAGAEQVFFLGDAVGYLPDASGVLARLAQARITCVRGNHEAMLLGELELDQRRDQVYRLAQTREQLGPGELEQVAAWPDRVKIKHNGRSILAMHGSPQDALNHYVYPDSDLGFVEGLGFDMIVLAHTHRPFVRRAGRTLVVNAGSCGLPRQGDGCLSAAVYDSLSGQAQVLAVDMEVDKMLDSYGPAIHDQVRQVLLRRG